MTGEPRAPSRGIASHTLTIDPVSQVIGNKYETYSKMLLEDKEPGCVTARRARWAAGVRTDLLLPLLRAPRQAMDELGLKRYCCRRMILTHVDLVDKLLSYQVRLRNVWSASARTGSRRQRAFRPLPFVHHPADVCGEGARCGPSAIGGRGSAPSFSPTGFGVVVASSCSVRRTHARGRAQRSCSAARQARGGAAGAWRRGVAILARVRSPRALRGESCRPPRLAHAEERGLPRGAASAPARHRTP